MAVNVLDSIHTEQRIYPWMQQCVYPEEMDGINPIWLNHPMESALNLTFCSFIHIVYSFNYCFC